MSWFSDLLDWFRRHQPQPPAPPVPPVDPPHPSTDLEATRIELLKAHNAERARFGIAPLSRDARLDADCQVHAEYDAKIGRLDHSTWNHYWAGENVAEDQGGVAATVKMWMGSPPHRASILNPQFRWVGFGVAKGRDIGYGDTYWCTEFK